MKYEAFRSGETVYRRLTSVSSRSCTATAAPGKGYDSSARKTDMAQVPDRLYDLPPSAKLVLKVLESDDQLTQSQIAEESRLDKRTVRNALKRLRDVDAVRERVSFRDARQSLYSIPESTSIGGTAADTDATSSG